MPNAPSMSPVATLTILVAALGIGLSCSAPGGSARQESPAPDFNYITDEELESAMWQLGDGVRSLQAIFGREGPLSKSQRAEVIQILDQMIVATEELGPDGVSTNHPRIDDNLGRFREKLMIARSSASMNPPRYYLVVNLMDTCLACHSRE